MTIPDALYQQCRDKLTTLEEWECARQIIPLVYAAGRAQGLEEAAKVCEEWTGQFIRELISDHYAELIRSLIPPPSEAKP